MGDKDWDAILEAKNLVYLMKLDVSMQHQRRLAETDRKDAFDIRAVRAEEKRQEETVLAE
jgi:hypothetical protein